MIHFSVRYLDVSDKQDCSSATSYCQQNERCLVEWTPCRGKIHGLENVHITEKLKSKKMTSKDTKPALTTIYIAQVAEPNVRRGHYKSARSRRRLGQARW